jgi:hypothetical protein
MFGWERVTQLKPASVPSTACIVSYTYAAKVRGPAWRALVCFAQRPRAARFDPQPPNPRTVWRWLCDMHAPAACEYNVGEFVSHGARVFKNGVCTIGYVFSRKFALYLLHSPHGLVHSNYHPDSLIGHLAHLNYISAFMCDPPLVLFGDEAKTSTVFNNQVTTR